MKELKIETKRGVLLDGVLFAADGGADTVLICITGIHGNFYSNPFYYNIGDTLSAAGIDFIYAQTNDAFGAIRTMNTHTGREEIIGSWNERFRLADEDIEAYLDYAAQQGYRHIILAGHSLGANKVIYYLSRHHTPRVEHFLLLSPANLDYMTASVTPQQREIIRQLYDRGHAAEMLPFLLMGWVECTVGTAYDWVHSGLLNNVHTSPDGDFGQVSQITHTGALLIGTYDNFTDGDPSGFLRNINSHIPTAAHNRLLFIERTGHTYQQKHQEVADKILQLIRDWLEVAKQ
ncbi:MAG: alpha/beta fold hydrolase [Bacteroidaceae bacterium]|nr:alpha/beta fold hydrolase [Bacteroidaceae bacterium]